MYLDDSNKIVTLWLTFRVARLAYLFAPMHEISMKSNARTLVEFKAHLLKSNGERSEMWHHLCPFPLAPHARLSCCTALHALPLAPHCTPPFLHCMQIIMLLVNKILCTMVRAATLMATSRAKYYGVSLQLTLSPSFVTSSLIY